ncbi:MAG: acyl-CoA dehydrogenase family protein, partial [Solirubrobacteraceae bacterium]
AMRHATAWAREVMPQGDRLEAGARRLSMTLGRSLSLALLASHAQWCLDHGFGPRTAAAARRFAQSAVDQIADAAPEDTRLLTARL